MAECGEDNSAESNQLPEEEQGYDEEEQGYDDDDQHQYSEEEWYSDDYYPVSSEEDDDDYYQGSSFQHIYRCYPVSVLNKDHLESGDKIIMPQSALASLAHRQIDYPMLFELRNLNTDRVSRCGVLEFTAEEGRILLPNWMMENLKLQEGDCVQMKNITLLKGEYVKLQPHKKEFLDVSNAKAILEKTLRDFTCLTTGDTIMIPYNNKKFYMDVLETKPNAAVSIVETDCEVDFAPPLDYNEPEKPVVSNLPSRKEPTKEGNISPIFIPFTGVARCLNGKETFSEVRKALLNTAEQEPEKKKDTKFMPFTGEARRLGVGNPLPQSLVSVSPSLLDDQQPEIVNGTNVSSWSTIPARHHSVKSPLGSKQDSQKKEEKSQAFTGKKGTKVIPFTGAARRLDDGNTLPESVVSVSRFAVLDDPATTDC